MPTTDPRIDAYIEKAAPFAQPILRHLRALAHRALPEAEEGIKWGMPHFMVKGKNVAGMAAFKAHCAFVIHGEDREVGDPGMGAYGKIGSLADLPDETVLVTAIQNAAARVLVTGTAVKKPKKSKKPPIAEPADVTAALADNPAARAVFDGFAPSNRREYLEWITEAKRAETRTRRIAQMVEWVAEGRKRNWKYENC